MLGPSQVTVYIRKLSSAKISVYYIIIRFLRTENITDTRLPNSSIHPEGRTDEKKVI